ncbi:MAG: 3,4-dihydroxy 2-butanone 4-phosphate synthase / cyclohydrolase [Thermoleophilaceae bacterium]|jgi:3,4-dihydroxy 2-butanone 4-phosphate synthase/GTP cyclohydrolase II|nr:3,4-dihydroxy 2-butanone 4-phosphate synthase / cyclohydrolase [Thermoleophilaceae bacterium]
MHGVTPSLDSGLSDRGPVGRALADLAAGAMIVVDDDEERDNRGSVVMAAELVTAEAINFMNRRAGGWVCLALPPDRCDELELEPPPPRNGGRAHTPFTATIDAKEGVSTGTSAQDQAASIKVATDAECGPDDIVSPGHVQPMRAEPGGVLKRAGHAEAAVDLARLAGLTAAAVVCEVQKEDGSMARRDDLRAFCAEHGLTMIGIDELIAYRHRHDRLIERVADVDLPTRHGNFRVIAYRSTTDDELHVAYVKGDVADRADVLVRVHTACLTGDVFHSQRCGCGELLEAALDRIEDEGAGVLVYLSPERNGGTLFAELEAAPPHHGARPRTFRNYGIGAQILHDLGLKSIRILTNSPKRIVGLDGYGLTVTSQIALGEGS